MRGELQARAFLVTGPPGCGKTSLLREALTRLDLPAGGFLTEEVRRGGHRTGFRLVTLDGRRAMLAAVDSPSAVRVGKYGVNLAALDELGVPALEDALARGHLVVVDEIGKMEMASSRFRRAVEAALDGGSVVLGTILLAPHPWADALRARPEVLILRLAPAERERVREHLVTLVRECMERRRDSEASTA